MTMKKIRKEETLHEHALIAMTLSLLGGYLDAYTYVLKGGVFANAQTGNVVLFSISLLSGQFSQIDKYLFPILAFSIGILISEYLKSNGKLFNNSLRIKMVLFIELIILLLIGFAGEFLSDFTVTCIVSFVAAIQVSTFNRLHGAAVATTMITGNLRSSMEHLHQFLHYKDKKAGIKFLLYLTVIVFFGAGASLGGIISSFAGESSIYFCTLFIALAFVLILKEEHSGIYTE